jgi:hypothetical protein
MRTRLLMPLCCALFYFLPTWSFTQINTERFRQDSDSTGLTGHVDMEATVMTGNVNLQFYNVGGRINYNWGPAYSFAVFDGGFGWEKAKSLYQQSLAHLRHVHTMNNKIQLEVFLQHDVNKKRKLLSRWLSGAGVRLKVLKKGPLKYRQGFSYMYEKEEYDLPLDSFHGQHTQAHRLNAYTTLEFDLKAPFRFLSVSYIQPEIGDWRDYKLITENGLLIDAGKWLDVTLKINGRYDSKPPDNTKKLDTISKMGITVKF